MAHEALEMEMKVISDGGILHKNMARFLNNPRFSDVIFNVGDAKINAHKVILAGRSDYFDSLLAEAKEVKIDVPLRAFEEVLKYIYLGTLSIPSEADMVADILTLARKFSLEALAKLMSKKMTTSLNSQNVCQTLNIATACHLQELKKNCLTFVDKNVAEILKNDTFSSLSQASMIALLERDDFPPEIEVFKLAERWCKFNTDKDGLVKNCIKFTETDIPEALKKLGPSEKDLATPFNPQVTTLLKSTIKVENVCPTLNAANSHALVELQEICRQFIVYNFPEVLSNGNCQQLSKESLVSLLESESCYVREISLFKLVEKWCQHNKALDDATLLSCIRFSIMTVSEIISVVWPSNLLTPDKLLEFISEIIGVKPKTSKSRAFLVLNKNVASEKRGAKVVAGIDANYLLGGKIVENYFARHVINDNETIVVKLDGAYWINYIEMRLYEKTDNSYSYYIEVSYDGRNWTKIIDHDRFLCRSIQHLYFNEEMVQFIKIVGTKALSGNNFELVSLEAFLTNDIPTLANGIIRPKYNVASLQKGADCIEGNFPNNILSGEKKYFTSHRLGKGTIVVHLAQPFLISSVKLLFHENFSYKYRIETSTDRSQWEAAVDKTDALYRGWQVHTFSERPVVYVRIIGTHALNIKNNRSDLIFGVELGGEEVGSDLLKRSEGKTKNVRQIK